jgi:uracil-DNA glycosylase
MAIIRLNSSTGCPVCKLPIAKSRGDENSPILIAIDEPTQDDINAGKVFSGDYATIFRKYLAKQGLDLWSFSMTSLFQHPVKGKKDGCRDPFIAQFMNTAMNKKLIVLMGTEITKTFLKKNAIETSGLVMKSDLLTAPCFCIQSPSDIFAGTCGEFDLAIRKLGKYIKENNIK